jgi:probable HAF family extracellular repeat protein
MARPYEPKRFKIAEKGTMAVTVILMCPALGMWRDRFVKKNSHFFCIVLAGALLILNASHFAWSQTRQYSVIDVGIPAGGFAAFPVAISNDSRITGYAHFSANVTHPFIWDATNGIRDIGLPPGFSSAFPEGINSLGHVAGTAINSDGLHAFYWDIKSGFQILSSQSTAGVFLGLPAPSLSETDQVIGVLRDQPAPQLSSAFLWNPRGGLVELPPPCSGLGFSWAGAVSQNGQFVGGEIGCSGSNPPAVVAIWSGGTWTPLSDAAGGVCFPSGVNDKGQVAGCISFSAGSNIIQHAALWSDNVPRDLGTIPGFQFSQALGINNAGQVVGRSDDPQQGTHAFIWDADNGMRDLNSLIPPNLGLKLTQAVAIDNSGEIIATDQSRTFLLKPQGCQVNWHAKFFHQWDAPQLHHPNAAVTEPPTQLTNNFVTQYFGFIPSPNPSSSVSRPVALCPTRKSGCALTSASTLLSSFQTSATENPLLLDSQLKELRYGTGRISLCPIGQPDCNPSDLVEFPDECEMNWNFDWLFPFTVASVDFEDVATGSGLLDPDVDNVVTLDDYLNQHVCKDQDRVLLKLQERAATGDFTLQESGEHFVLVTGQVQNSSAQSTDWTVFDPGWNPCNSFDGLTPLPPEPASPCGPNTSPPSHNITTLKGHLNGFFTNSGNAFRTFQVSGVRTYRDISGSGLIPGAISISANSPVELLVTDATGRALGSLTNGSDAFAISQGSYIREFLFADDSGIGLPSGDATGRKVAVIRRPKPGIYQVDVSGTGLGTYMLSFQSLTTDGSIHTVEVIGIANVGSHSTYSFTFDGRAGTSGILKIATFESMLDDINNSERLGSITKRRALLLSRIIQRAQEEALEGNHQKARHVLKEFKEHVRESRKDIANAAVNVFLEDANSLITQIPVSTDDKEEESDRRHD